MGKDIAGEKWIYDENLELVKVYGWTFLLEILFFVGYGVV